MSFFAPSWSVPILISVAIGILCGAVNGFGIAFCRIPPFIMTMCMMLAARGAAYVYTNAKAIFNLNQEFVNISNGFLGRTFDESGKVVYTGKQTSSGSSTGSFLVQVTATDLNIRKGPGTNYAKTGKYTGKGVFTITEVKSGTGSTAGWGKLKSGAGWISLDYCKRL